MSETRCYTSFGFVFKVISAFLRSEFFEDGNLDFLNSLILSVVFWFGDLNFRIEDLEMHVVKAAIETNKLSMLWEKDQVRDVEVKMKLA